MKRSNAIELGLTIPLQRYLHIKALPYSQEPDRRFCWDLHVILLRGRPSLPRERNRAMLYYLIVCRSLTYAQRTAAALERAADKIARFAREEGLEAHARSVLIRCKKEES